MKISKGLEFSVVALPGVGKMPAKGENEKEARREFYVASTRAMQRLAIGGLEHNSHCKATHRNIDINSHPVIYISAFMHLVPCDLDAIRGTI
jgi:superfamily I DNA/RNA helicase